MSQLPTVAEITVLHQAYAPTRAAFEKVHTHCGIVWRIAEQLLAGPGGAGLDADLVRAGCLLHDIGVYRLYDDEGRLDGANYVRHGLLGAEILRKEGLPEVLHRFCSCHTGVGLTRHDVLSQDLPIPVDDYLPESAEERLVMYADKFHSKSNPPRFLRSATFAAKIRRFGEDKVVAFDALMAEFGVPELGPFEAEFGHRVS
ncbi:HDIG domain-containing metalloprotein [Embleya sp. NBC_00896]|uniref:HDIG domain-containing metalloprotein n=1 Tax=Embleya sp. NBC_00896 TaxID=2975961 RepID=UPI002F90D143|nr:HDIG domain-containing protein [Embleya sp. NBC_00896]